MTIRTRAITVISAIALAVAAVGTVSAQGPGRGVRGMGPGRGPGAGPLPMLRQLDLTDAQREQIQGIVGDRQPQGDRQALGKLHQELMNAIMADTPDLGRIDQIKASIAEAETAALNERVALQLRISQEVLTPEQRQKAREQQPRGPRGRGL